MRDSLIIFNYFPQLTQEQKNQYYVLYDLYSGWNKKINLISRRDFEFFYERHVLHSLAIAKVIQFRKEAEIMDFGTGGGFPGIPLAILCPESKFTLVDSIEKKIKAVNEIISSTGLKNVSAYHARAEEINDAYDFIITRAAGKIDDLVKWTRGKYKKMNMYELPNGLLCLKGGDLKDELKNFENKAKIFDIKDHFKEEFFETKKVVYIPGRF